MYIPTKSLEMNIRPLQELLEEAEHGT